MVVGVLLTERNEKISAGKTNARKKRKPNNEKRGGELSGKNST